MITRSILINKINGAGLFSLPIDFIRQLGWMDRDRLYIIILNDKKILIDKKLPTTNENIQSIFETKLNRVKIQGGSPTHRLTLKKDIMNIMEFTMDNRTINMDVVREGILITKT